MGLQWKWPRVTMVPFRAPRAMSGTQPRRGGTEDPTSRPARGAAGATPATVCPDRIERSQVDRIDASRSIARARIRDSVATPMREASGIDTSAIKPVCLAPYGCDR